MITRGLVEPHQIIHFEGEDFYYVATIPFTRFLQWQMPPAFLNQIMAGAVLKETNEDVARLDEAMFDRWLQDVGSNLPEAVDVMMLELEARLRRLALSYEPTCDREVKAAAGSTRPSRPPPAVRLPSTAGSISSTRTASEALLLSRGRRLPFRADGPAWCRAPDAPAGCRLLPGKSRSPGPL